MRKPPIPTSAPDWLRTTLEILTGRRRNKIAVPPAQTLTFSASPTQAECEALYAYVGEVRSSLESMVRRFDE